MPRDAIQITSIDAPRPPSAPRLNPPRTTPPRGQTCTHSKFKHLSTPRGGGGGRAPVVNPRLYIYSHTSARVLVMGVHTSRLRVIPPRPIASLPDPIARVDRGARDRGAGRSRAGGCLSVFLPVVTHERVHAPRPGPTVGPWGRPTRARVRPRARSTTSRVVASIRDDASSTAVPHTRTRAFGTRTSRTFRRVRSTLERTLVTSRTHARTHARAHRFRINTPHHHTTRET